MRVYRVTSTCIEIQKMNSARLPIPSRLRCFSWGMASSVTLASVPCAASRSGCVTLSRARQHLPPVRTPLLRRLSNAARHHLHVPLRVSHPLCSLRAPLLPLFVSDAYSSMCRPHSSSRTIVHPLPTLVPSASRWPRSRIGFDGAHDALNTAINDYPMN